MGVSVNAQLNPHNEYVTAVHEAGRLMIERMVNIFHFNDLVYAMSANGKKYNNHVKVLKDYTSKVC